MKIYRPGTRTHVAMVQPARHGKLYRTSDFVDDNGEPRMFQVKFVEGVADVPDNLGRYMIDTEQASKSPIIVPTKQGVTA